jgi:hypothetical protein
MAAHSLPCADYVNFYALPAIHVLAGVRERRHARVKRGHDDGGAFADDEVMTVSA